MSTFKKTEKVEVNEENEHILIGCMQIAVHDCQNCRTPEKKPESYCPMFRHVLERVL